MKRYKLISIILSILLIGVVGFIVVNKYSNNLDLEKIEIFNNGTQKGYIYGYEKAMIDVVQKASTCEIVPLTIQNKTINLFAIECIPKIDNTNFTV